VTLFDSSRLTLIERAFVGGPCRALNRVERALGHRWSLPSLNWVFEPRLRGLVRAGGFGILHAQEPQTFDSVRRAARGLPVALTVHGPTHREVASASHLDLEHPTIRLVRDYEARAYREADAVISVDRAHAEYVRGFGRRDRIWIIPNFVDTRRFNPEAPAEPFPDEVEAWLAGRPALFCARRGSWAERAR